MSGFTDNVVALTGASGGIGSRIAQAFQGEGASVSRFDLHRPNEVDDADLWNVGDVRSTGNVNRFVESTIETFGRVDVLVNCANAVGRASIHEITDDEWARILDINMSGSFRCTRALLPHMLMQMHGVVANVASQADVRVEGDALGLVDI